MFGKGLSKKKVGRYISKVTNGSLSLKQDDKYKYFA